MITIPEDATPADIVGETDLLAGQNWLRKETVQVFAQMMESGGFPWERIQALEPMAIEVGTNGKVLTQGHHRWVAAKLAGVEIPHPIEMRYGYLNRGKQVPYAFRWDEVHWE